MKQEHQKQPFHNSRSSIGGMIHMAGALAPLLIHELVEDPQRKWRYIRICAAATAIASGVLWRDRIKREREPAGAEAHAGRER